MTDETPHSEGQPSPPAPEEHPTAETKPFTYDDAVAQAGDEDDVAPAPTPPPSVPSAEAPTQAAPAAAPGYAAASPAAAPAPVAERPAGIFIPKWVGIVAAAIVAALIFGGIGYAIGDSSSDSGPTQNASNAFPNGNGNGNGRTFPGGGQFPGNGTNLPNGGQLPNGNGNGNGNSNGGSDGTTASNAGFLGVGVQASTDGKGVEISEVADNSPASKAGLQQGDVITAIDGDDVTSADAVRTAVQAKRSGDEISVTYTRDGQSNTVKVTLTSRSQAQSS
jgi:membrane-associated protease RseP (regulator of RpoE activity)